jgi:membrane-bound serine protease (ClpP class)
MILMDSSIPELRVSVSVIVAVVAALAAILGLLVRLTVASQRRRSITGASGMIDESGRALTPLGPGQLGRVSTHGEIWRAVSVEPIAKGESVRVVTVDGLTLTVRRETAGRLPAEKSESNPAQGGSEDRS